MEIQDAKLKNLGDAKKYEDLDGMTLEKLSFGLWWVQHLKQFKALIVISLAVIIGISWGYTLYNFAMYIAVGMKADEALVRDMVKNEGANREYVAYQTPMEPQVSSTYMLRSGDGKFDLFAKMNNANEKYWAEFSYYFIYDGGATAKTKSFILPAEEKYLVSLAQDLGSASDAQIQIENLTWHRINAHEIKDWQQFRSSRMNIPISDVKFSPDSSSGVSDKLSLNRLEFNVSNDTAYNYWNAYFITVITSGMDNVVAINKNSLSEFMAGKSRKVELVWPGDLPPVSNVDVFPEIDIMNKSAYMKYSGE